MAALHSRVCSQFMEEAFSGFCGVRANLFKGNTAKLGDFVSDLNRVRRFDL